MRAFVVGPSRVRCHSCMTAVYLSSKKQPLAPSMIPTNSCRTLTFGQCSRGESLTKERLKQLYLQHQACTAVHRNLHKQWRDL